jgi:hypothetical protein
MEDALTIVLKEPPRRMIHACDRMLVAEKKEMVMMIVTEKKR